MDSDRSSPERVNTARVMDEIKRYISQNKEELVQTIEEEEELSFEDGFVSEPETRERWSPPPSRFISQNCLPQAQPKKPLDFRINMKQVGERDGLFGNTPRSRQLEEEMEEIILGFTKKLR